MKKAKCYAEGDVIETETEQGQNANIGDDTRARAMKFISERQEAEKEVTPKKKKSKAKVSKTNAATESHSRMNPMGDTYRKGGYVRAADGIAKKGKTRGKIC